MATVSITIPDAIVPRLTVAARAQYPQFSGLTDVQLFKKVTADHWSQMLAAYEANQAATTAATQAQTDAGGIG